MTTIREPLAPLPSSVAGQCGYTAAAAPSAPRHQPADEPADPVHRLVDQCLGGQQRHAHPTPPALAERVAGEHEHARLVEKAVAERLRVHPEARHVGPHEEPATVRSVRNAEPGEAVDEGATASAVHLEVRPARVRVRAEGGQGGQLRERRARAGGRALQRLHGVDESRRADQVADAEAGHRVRLRESRKDDGALPVGAPGQEGEERILAEHDILVDLVGKDDQIEVFGGPGQLPHALRPDARTGRVGRVDEDEDFCAPGMYAEVVRTEVEGAVTTGGDRHDIAAGHSDRLIVGAVAGVLAGHPVTRVDQRQHGQEESLLGAVGDGDLGVRVHGDAPLGCVAAGDALAQGEEAAHGFGGVGAGRAGGPVLGETCQAALDDRRGGVEVGVAASQRDDVFAGASERHHAVA